LVGDDKLLCKFPRFLEKTGGLVRCGRCLHCRIFKRKERTTRIFFESKHTEHLLFVHLTYNNEHLPTTTVCPNTGLIFQHSSGVLVKSDIQKFMKRLRKSLSPLKFRYVCAGEYGEQKGRPHYHIIFFGNVPELVIKKAWDKGLIHVGQVTPASVAYCCKYLINSKAAFMRSGRIAPFSTQSRKPGLGSCYLRPSIVRWHKSGLKSYVQCNHLKLHMPRFYRDKIFSKRERWVINTRDHRLALDKLRAELARLSRFNISNPMEYREEQRLRDSRRVKLESRENLKV